ncbi:thioesterase II family protein [Hamadaea tsunoensis]|uniref:thioesterase II family protein n=1 Tax=Hamadaea tsunoensis TaxID=53368 RepID=UPI001FE13384|nr:alpha/beta fold hydrolase [Hamadaea tsunoensis]
MPGHPARWFHPALDEVPPGPRVFCFPHAGGNPRTFLSWQPLLESPGDGCTPRIVVVGMPSRGHRAHELPTTSVTDLADGAAEAIARVAGEHPAYLFGHGLGAVVAFETARRLRGVPGVRHLIASGCLAPSSLPSNRTMRTAGLRGREFADAVALSGGLPPEIVAAEQLHDLLLPGLQADFRLAAEYEYRSASPLTIGLTLINGQDSGTDPAALLPWRDETVETPAYHWAPGGHFYFQQRPRAVADLLRTLTASAPAHHVELI